jgi:hypothetical protein
LQRSLILAVGVTEYFPLRIKFDGCVLPGTLRLRPGKETAATIGPTGGAYQGLSFGLGCKNSGIPSPEENNARRRNNTNKASIFLSQKGKFILIVQIPVTR